MDLPVSLGPDIASALQILVWIGFGLGVIVHLVCALWVLEWGLRYRERFQERLVLLPGWLWVLATLIGGLFTGVAFWLCHWSMLNPRIERR